MWQRRPGVWRCDYVLPYSGPLCAEFGTWAEAMADACKVEESRQWI